MQFLREYEAAVALIQRTEGYKRHALVGSQYIVGEGRDCDIVVLVDYRDDFAYELLDGDYKAEDHQRFYEQLEDSSDFLSIRHGPINLLVTNCGQFFDNFKLAAEVCKAARIADRPTRVKIHKIVLYGEDA